MTSEHQVPPSGAAAAAPADVPAPSAPVRPGAARFWRGVLGVVAVLALLLSGLLWERMSTLQGQLTRQTSDAAASAAEARVLVRQTQERQRDLVARQAVIEARLGELALQRSQLDELLQSLSRSRDENLVVDLEASIRLAQQQAELTGSVAPLLAALESAQRRAKGVPQARLLPVQRALARDIARIKATPLADTPTLLARLDELVRLVDALPLANAAVAAPAAAARVPSPSAPAQPLPGWEQLWQRALDEARSLVRVSRIDQPEAALLAPEQAYFLRQNLKLLLLNARLGLLARQHAAARSDLGQAASLLQRYFDGAASGTRAAVDLLQQAKNQMKALELPRVDDTLAALATAAAGH